MINIPNNDATVLQARGRRGFTLLETLMIMTVIGSVLAVGGLGIDRVFRAMALTHAGNKVVRIFEAARQQALTKNTMNAVVLVTSLGGELDGRALTVLEYTSTGGWNQIREWEVLPDGIVVDVGATGADGSFVGNGPRQFPHADSDSTGAPVAHGGRANLPPGTYAARILLPGGGLLNPAEAAQFRLVEGVVKSGVDHAARVDAGGVPANYYRIIVLGATGKTKVERP